MTAVRETPLRGNPVRLTRRPFAALAVLLVIALGVPLAADAPAVAATRLRVSPTNPIPREFVSLRGRLGTSVARPVRLQYYASGWRNLATKKSARTGAFAFRTRAVKWSRKYRVVAPRVTINGRFYKFEKTPERVVRTVRPRRAMRLVPAQIGQAPATTTLSTTAGLIPVATKFRPVRKGRVVTLQRYRSGAWRKVTAGRQNARGAVTFNIPIGAARNYKHRAVASYAGVALRVARRPISVGAPNFTDHFSGSTLNPNNWEYRQLGSRNPAGNRECAESSKSAVAVGGGTLRLQVKEIKNNPLLTHAMGDPYDETADCPDGQYYNGHIGSQGRVQTTYGILAARMKAAPGLGKHSAFWTRPPSGGNAEIDVMEYFGRRNNVQHKVYWDGGNHGRVFDLSHVLGEGQNYTNGYHIFSVEWTSKVYIFRVDGVETFRTARGSSHVDHFMILSLLSSDYALPHLDRSRDHTTYVDWVRVWR